MAARADHVVAFPQLLGVPETREGEHSPGFRHVQAFLERFGYLDADQYETGELDVATSQALAEFQEFIGIEPTGHFDEATRAEMTRPRCALPDVSRGVEFATTCAWDR